MSHTARAQDAQAQVSTEPIVTRNTEAPRHALDAELAYFTSDDSASSLHVQTTQLGFRYALSLHWALSARIGLAVVVSSPEHGDADREFRPSNPEVLAWPTVPQPFSHARMRLGFGISGPLSTIDRGGDARLQRTALSDAQGIDGLSRMWRWAPNRSALIGAAELELDAAKELTFELEAWPALMVPSREEFFQEPLEFVLPVAVAAAAHRGAFRVGPRVRMVWLPMGALDHAQLSIEPFVGLRFDHAFIEARYTLNIDEPLAGPRGPQIWGAHLMGGCDL